MLANAQRLACIVKIVFKYCPSSLLCSRINGSSTKTSDLLKAEGNSQRSQRSPGDDWLVWIPAWVYTVYLCVKQLNTVIKDYESAFDAV